MIIEPYSIKRTTDTSTEPITVSEAKAHLRVDTTDDDSYITSLIKVARQSAEISLRRSLGVNQVYQVAYKTYPTVQRKLRIPNPPFISISSLKYFDLSNTEHTVSSDNLVVDSTGDTNAFVAIKSSTIFQEISFEKIAPVVLTYTAGYSDVADIPQPIIQGMYLLLSHYYDTREPISYTGTPIAIPRSVDFLFNQYKVRMP
jgi:uncharacterized phiE125 gp8 family phage protein